MWRTCLNCEGQFFRGGIKNANVCPDCKIERQNKALRRRLKKNTYDTFLITDQKRNIIKKEINYPEITCKFCEEFKPTKHKNGVYCIDCNILKPYPNANAIRCDACNGMFWTKHKNKNTFCSPSCKEVLREHFECITCEERILPEKPVTTKFCSKKCSTTMQLINRLRKTSYRKGGNLQYRYDRVKSLNVKQSIIDEFKKDLKGEK